MADMSLREFAARMTSLSIQVDHAEHEALEAAAQLIQEEAKASIGTYQDAIGPFPSWAPLAPSTRDDKTRHGYAPPDNPLLRTGEMRATIERTVGQHEAWVGSNDQVAVYQEFGTVRMPPRPFIGSAAARKAPEAERLMAEIALKPLMSGTPGVSRPIRGRGQRSSRPAKPRVRR